MSGDRGASSVTAGRWPVPSVRVAMRAFLGAVAVAACAVLLTVAGAIDETAVAVGLATFGCGLAVLVAALVADRGRFQPLMSVGSWSAVLATSLAFVLLAIDGRRGWPDPPRLLETSAAVLGAIGAWSIGCGLALVARSTAWPVLLSQWLAVAMGSIGALFVLALATAPDWVNATVRAAGATWVERGLAAVMVTGIGALVAQPVLLRLTRAAVDDQAGALGGRRVPVDLRCPRCGASCTVSANVDGSCPACRLALRVDLAEPRCRCGYLLHALEAPSCPECGAAVPEALRWSPVRPSPESP